MGENDKDRIAVEGVWLVREGGYAVVKVEVRGYWYEVIREWSDGNFSHIAEPAGIRDAVRTTPMIVASPPTSEGASE